MIEGVRITPLKQIPDERGKIMHMLRCDDPDFDQFGEIYFSMVYPGIVKGWHKHQVMTLNYAVVVGQIKLGLFDERKGSPTEGKVQELVLGNENYSLVTVPPGVWNGFQGLGGTPSIVANCATHPHSPDEISRIDPFKNHIPYKWDLKHG